EALGGAVLERSGRGLVRDPLHDRRVGLRRERRGVGQPARERDHLLTLGDRHQVAHGRRRHHLGARREQARVALEVPLRGAGGAHAPPFAAAGRVPRSVVYGHAASSYRTVDLALAIAQGIGLALACGIRPFLPALLAGALAAANLGIDFGGTDFV